MGGWEALAREYGEGDRGPLAHAIHWERGQCCIIGGLFSHLYSHKKQNFKEIYFYSRIKSLPSTSLKIDVYRASRAENRRKCKIVC